MTLGIEFERPRRGAEIAQRITQPIDTEVREPLVAFTGDTTIDVAEREAVVREARLLILEATFLDDRIPPEEARRRGHVHLRQIAERAALFSNEALLLTHFSARHRSAEIPELLRRELPPELLERTVPLLDEGAA